MEQTKGFTLIELMIVVAIIGILSALAYPSYIEYVTRSHRAAAESHMLDIASKEERYLLDARAYVSSLTTLGIPTPIEVSEFYSFGTAGSEVTVGSAPPSFTITATPIGVQATRDTRCGTLTLRSDGTRTASGSAGVAGCWRR